MSRFSDVRPVATRLYFLPVETRVPLKFGPETLTYVTCARAWRSPTEWGAKPRGGARRRSAFNGTELVE